MTTIKYSTEGGYALEISGHAGYDVAGKDIVCAGISTLFFTLVNVLGAEQPRVWMGDGEAGVEVRSGRSERLDAVFGTVITGMRLIAEKFPDNVKVESKN